MCRPAAAACTIPVAVFICRRYQSVYKWSVDSWVQLSEFYRLKRKEWENCRSGEKRKNQW